MATLSLTDEQILQLRRLAMDTGLNQHVLEKLIDHNLDVPMLVKNEAAAMAHAKRAGLDMAERSKLKNALRVHVDKFVEEKIHECDRSVDDVDADARRAVEAQRQLAAVRAQKRHETAQSAKGDEFIVNGGVCANYRWTQELDELTVAVELPPGTKKSDVVCRVQNETLVIGLRGQDPMVDGILHGRVKADQAIWQLQDSHRLLLNLPKWPFPQLDWWSRLLQGEAEINTDECRQGASTNLYAGPGQRRFRFQKVELGGLTGVDRKFSPEEAERAWQDFFEKFPDMRAYELRLRGGSVEDQEASLVAALEEAMGERE